MVFQYHMTTLLAMVLTLVVAGFLFAPFWVREVPRPVSQETLDQIDREIEDEVRALRAGAGTQFEAEA